jgi:hypothetical protein
VRGAGQPGCLIVLPRITLAPDFDKVSFKMLDMFPKTEAASIQEPKSWKSLIVDPDCYDSEGGEWSHDAHLAM